MRVHMYAEAAKCPRANCQLLYPRAMTNIIYLILRVKWF